MYCEASVRDTVAMVLQSKGTRREKVRALVALRRQMKRYLKALSNGMRHLSADLHTVGVARLMRTMDRVEDSILYVSDVAMALIKESASLSYGYGPCGRAIPQWERS